MHQTVVINIIVLLLSIIIIGVRAHQESGEWSCESDESEIRVVAEFNPGVVTIDGHADDWEDIEASEFPLLPALDPHSDHAYKHGQLTLKALHDGRDVFFLLQVDGNYVYSQGDNNKCPSVALMFQIGENATYHNMGGCKESPGSCTNKTCKGHEVDIMHFSIGSAIPGRLYGANHIDNRDGNGGDRFGHLVDVYSWTPHCRYLDGMGPSGNDSSAQNDWKGAWWHSSFNVQSGFVEDDSPYGSDGSEGTYYFEFSRPLRTADRLQQTVQLLTVTSLAATKFVFASNYIPRTDENEPRLDAQLTIGGLSKLSAAFWYPVDGTPWHGSGHYTINCDWVPLDIPASGRALTKSSPGGSTGSAFALLFSVVALCLSVFVMYRMVSPKAIAFTPMENL
ncbi:hypothetical protein ACFE04_016865 [Oxalis oulophora]